MNRGRPTCGGDLSSSFHDHIKHIPGRRVAVVEVVRSSNGRLRIRSQIRGGNGTDLVQQGLIDGEIPGRDVVLVTSVDRDVVSLGSLQNETHELINEAVHILAPRRRRVQKTKKPACRGVNNRAPGR